MLKKRGYKFKREWAGGKREGLNVGKEVRYV